MKCPSCGYGLHIEDEKCPHCGKENPYYKKHRADMGKYEQDYSEVKRDVYAKTGFFTKLTVKITVIAVLVALELGTLVFHHFSWDIKSAINKQRAEKNVEEYTRKLNELEQAENYIGLAEFYDRKDLYCCDEYKEFYKVHWVCSLYARVYDDFMELNAKRSYDTPQQRIVQLCSDLEDLYDSCERGEYDSPVYYSEQHTKTMEKILENVEAFLVVYGNLTEEEAENFPNLSNARKQLALEGGLGLDESN